MKLSQRHRAVLRNKTLVDHMLGLVVLTVPDQVNEPPSEVVILFRRESLNQLLLMYAAKEQTHDDKNQHAFHVIRVSSSPSSVEKR